MRQGEVGLDDSAFPQPLQRHRSEPEQRLVEMVMRHLNILPPDTLADSHAEGFDEGLLGGETGCVMLGAGPPGTAVLPLRRGEETIKKRFVMLPHEPLEPSHLHDVDPGADYQRREW